jgi:ubiquinol-cytochrome c reductase cytochrome b subunit
MSGPSSYVPKSNLAKWFDERLPVARLVHDSFIAFPTPRNLNYMWTFGGILTFCLVAQIVTGVILAMHYTASVDTAFNSVQHIRRDVNYGWLIQPMHAVGASMFFVAVYLHIFRGLYYGSYKAPREILWILGVFILLAMMATAFLGYTLPWGQMSFWGATVITNLFSSLDGIIPGMGTAIVTWLWGGFSVGNATLNRFFSLHYLLPFVIFGIVILHVWALHVVGQNNPTGLDIKQPSDAVPMHPYAITKDVFALFVFLIPFAYFVFFLPDYLGHADNYNEANPLVTPPHIVPEWYFLPFYAILRAIPDKLGGVIAMFASIAILAFAPWLDWSRVRSCKYRPIFKWCFWAFVATCLALGYLGALPAEEPYVTWARVFTFLYFAFFLIAMPLVGLIETPSQMPRSITESVLGAGAGSGGGGQMPAGAAAGPEKR